MCVQKGYRGKEWARLNLGIEGRAGTIEEANFPDDHFDSVTMGGVIEHLYDPYRVLQEIWRVLKPGGLFYFDAPNEDGLYSRIGNLYLRAQRRDWVVNLAPTFPPYHVQGFNPASVQRLLKRVGFQLEEFSIYGKVWPYDWKSIFAQTYGDSRGPTHQLVWKPVRGWHLHVCLG